MLSPATISHFLRRTSATVAAPWLRVNRVVAWAADRFEVRYIEGGATGGDRLAMVNQLGGLSEAPLAYGMLASVRARQFVPGVAVASER